MFHLYLWDVYFLRIPFNVHCSAGKESRLVLDIQRSASIRAEEEGATNNGEEGSNNTVAARYNAVQVKGHKTKGIGKEQTPVVHHSLINESYLWKTYYVLQSICTIISDSCYATV